MISVPQLVVATGCRPDDAERYAQPIADAFLKWDINNISRRAYFLAQIAHESRRFTKVEEDLFYTTTKACANAFGNRFANPDDWKPYLKNPEKLASFVYANKNGNGSVVSGDGFKYRGRGLIQLTGLSNYEAYQTKAQVSAVADPDLLTDPTFAADSAGWFWASHDCNRLADRPQDPLVPITRAINGGTNGLDERALLTAMAFRALRG